MVIAGGDVGYQWAQNVEWCSLADYLLQLYVGCDLIQGHVPRPFDHRLYPGCPASFHQLSDGQQLLHLGAV